MHWSFHFQLPHTATSKQKAVWLPLHRPQLWCCSLSLHVSWPHNVAGQDGEPVSLTSCQTPAWYWLPGWIDWKRLECVILAHVWQWYLLYSSWVCLSSWLTWQNPLIGHQEFTRLPVKSHIHWVTSTGAAPKTLPPLDFCSTVQW